MFNRARTIPSPQQRQEASVQVLVEVAAELEQRTKDRDALLARFAGLGASAASVNAMAMDLAARRQAGAGATELLELLREIQGQMSSVSAEADALTEAAENDGWPEIARQADAVRRQVNAVKGKLAAVQRDLASGAPSQRHRGFDAPERGQTGIDDRNFVERATEK